MKSEDIRAVLLPDGWHAVERGSLRTTCWLDPAGDTDGAYTFVDLSKRHPCRIVVATRHVLAVDLGLAD